MASIREVARLAKVAPCTVSRALNNSGYVSDETREKIRKAVDTLDYVPNQWIRNLYRQSTGIIGVVIPSVVHPFFSMLSSFLETELRAHGYNTMLCSTGTDDWRETEYLDTLKRNLFDGIIIGASLLPDDSYTRLEKPLVLLDRLIAGVPVVCSDYKKGGELAAGELLRCGCRSVVQVIGRLQYPTPSYESHEVFEMLLTEKGVQVKTLELDWWSVDNFDRCMDTAAKILMEYPDIDGMFGSDLQAMAFQRAALKLGKRVPEDLSIVSFDGTFLADMGAMKMTVIAQDIRLLAKETVKVLLKQINGLPIGAERFTVPLAIKPGETTVPNIRVGGGD